ncbi:MAG TPA: S8 family serine peptidase [Thermoleophilaceae bacterium]|nr:S8 family serine peptidase [Thermoleophilaceae bacterium]
MTIADIDVGVMLDHPDLVGRWTAGRDFFDNDSDPTSPTRNAHGTNVAGVLGATTDNGQGIAGIAPRARLMPIRTMDNILHQSTRLAAGIVYAADNGADVLSMSLGAESYSRPLRRAVAYAHRKGVVMVAAIGNELSYHHDFPGSFDEVIGVGGLNPDTADVAAKDSNLAPIATDFSVHAAYSNVGPQIDFGAPTQVFTTEWGGGYRENWDGTSAATPHVAAVAGLVISRARRLGLRLSAGEVRQVLIATASDLSGPRNGRRAGFDVVTGYGRVHAFEAVRRVSAATIPPDTDITSPIPFRTARGRLKVKGLVRGRSATRWTLELGRGEEPETWTPVASGSGTGTVRRPRRLGRVDARRLEAGGWTLRLRSTDAQGNSGEDRAFFFVNSDRQLKRGFPRFLGSSGEASPVLANLVGRREKEIVLATSDGLVRVYGGRKGRMVRGWPRGTRSAFASAGAARRIGRVRAGILATPAVGNIAGDRRPEVVAAGLDGRVYAWNRRGRRIRGFPVRIDARRPPSNGLQDASIYASPALANLDGRGRLDVVVGAADGKVYAWNGRGRRLPGWPVVARDGAGGDDAKILSSPAVGDIDGDGSLDVVEGTAETYGSAPTTSGRVYAWSGNGRLKPGWPIKPGALSANAIPLAGEGVPASPSLADVDGDGRDEVAISAFTGQPDLYRGDGTPFSGSTAHFDTAGGGPGSRSTAPSILALGANGSFGRPSAGGPLRFFSGAVDSRFATAAQAPAQKLPFEHLLGGWDARSGSWLPNFPAPVEGLQILATPAIADLDGDGSSEVVAGSSGYLLHAFRAGGGGELPGWPKNTGGWLLATPAVGDVDGDRRLEVVAITREGNLFVWDAPGSRRGLVEWPSFRHDPRNNGRYPGPVAPRR